MPSSKDGGKRGAGVRSSRVRRDRDGELRRFEPVSDELVLAAVERAEHHRERQDEGVMMSDIAEHLGCSRLVDNTAAASADRGVYRRWPAHAFAPARGSGVGFDKQRSLDRLSSLVETPAPRTTTVTAATPGARSRPQSRTRPRGGRTTVTASPAPMRSGSTTATSRSPPPAEPPRRITSAVTYPRGRNGRRSWDSDLIPPRGCPCAPSRLVPTYGTYDHPTLLHRPTAEHQTPPLAYRP